jgi:hypothetical protein
LTQGFPWAPFASLVGGGAVGALITSVVTARRSKIQPVGYRLEIERMFAGVAGPENRKIKISVADGEKKAEFDNLHQITLTVLNKGNKGIDEFTFGVELPLNYGAILYDVDAPDRHHTLSVLTPPSPDTPLRQIDLKVKPFNRRDRYTLSLYVNGPSESLDSSMVKLSSPAEVVFTTMPSTGEIFADALSSQSVLFGPIRISIR